MDRYKLTDLLLEKNFEDLSPSEREFVLKQISDKDEYDIFRRIALTSKDQSVSKRDESKELIMRAFDEEMRIGERLVSPSKADNGKSRAIIFWLAAAASVAFVLTIGTLAIYHDQDHRIAENKTKQFEESPTEKSSIDSMSQAVETIAHPNLEPDQKVAELRETELESQSLENENIQFEVSEEDADFMDMEEVNEGHLLTEGKDPKEEKHEEIVLNDLVVSDNEVEDKSIKSDSVYLADVENDAAGSNEIINQSVEVTAYDMAQPKNISAAKSAEVRSLNQKNAKEIKARKDTFKCKLKRINKQHYVSY